MRRMSHGTALPDVAPVVTPAEILAARAVVGAGLPRRPRRGVRRGPGAGDARARSGTGCLTAGPGGLRGQPARLDRARARRPGPRLPAGPRLRHARRRPRGRARRAPPPRGRHLRGRGRGRHLGARRRPRPRAPSRSPRRVRRAWGPRADPSPYEPMRKPAPFRHQSIPLTRPSWTACATGRPRHPGGRTAARSSGREVTVRHVHRPGLVLAGYTEHFEHRRDPDPGQHRVPLPRLARRRRRAGRVRPAPLVRPAGRHPDGRQPTCRTGSWRWPSSAACRCSARPSRPSRSWACSATSWRTTSPSSSRSTARSSTSTGSGSC